MKGQILGRFCSYSKENFSSSHVFSSTHFKTERKQNNFSTWLELFRLYPF